MLDYRGGTEQPFRLALDQMIPMRDGVKLSADIYLPNDGESFPVALLRTIYGNQEPRYLSWTKAFVEAGYAVVLQDCRGRYDSDGEWEPYVCEIPDGYDTHKWIGRQPWCDGNIGTFGLSYPGFTQTAPATLRSRYLKGLVPIASQQDNYGHHRVDGVIALATSLFFVTISRKSLQSDAIAMLDLPALLRRLPLISALDGLGDSPYYRGVIEHEKFDDFWSSYSLRDRYSEVDVPSYFMTGWYDSLSHETITVFNGWRAHARSEEARTKTKLLIGPWSHQVAPWGREQLGPNGEFEDRAFGSHAIGDTVADHLRWYDTRLKGIDTGMDDEPPIKLFIMGSNEWRFENEYPLARTEWRDLYLSGGGRLEDQASSDESSQSFIYDPADLPLDKDDIPLRSIKYHTSCSQPLLLGDKFAGIQLVGFIDKNDAEAQPTVIGPGGEEADDPPGPEIPLGDKVVWTYEVTNPTDVPLTDIVVVDDNETPGDTNDDFNPDPIVDGAGFNVGDTNTNNELDKGETWLYMAMEPADTTGPHKNIGKATGEGAGQTVMDEDPSHWLVVAPLTNNCIDHGKPKLLTMKYTGDGDDATSHSQDPKKVKVEGDPDDASPVFIIASSKDNPFDSKAKTWFSGFVDLNDPFGINAANAGASKLSGDTRVFVYDGDPNDQGTELLQFVKFHTSCSQPLFIGDQFGSLLLEAYVGEND